MRIHSFFRARPNLVRLIHILWICIWYALNAVIVYNMMLFWLMVYEEHKEIRSVSLNGMDYTLSRRRYCYRNCNAIIFCASGYRAKRPGCPIYNIRDLSHRLIQDVNISDITIRDQQLVIATNQDISSSLRSQKVAIPYDEYYINHEYYSHSDKTLNNLECDDGSGYNQLTKLRSKNCHYADNLNLIIEYK